MVSLVFSRLDYGNATLVGIPRHLLQRLQSVMNSAARLIYPSSRFSHITPLLQRLYWLKALERIDFKVAVLVYKCQHGTAPSYLADELCRSADVQGRSHLRSASQSQLVTVETAVQLLAIGPSWLPALVYGTTYRSTSNLLLLFKSLKVVLRLTCLKPPSLNSFVQCL